MQNVILKPRISEKAYALSKERNVFVFDVPQSANRLTVAKAVNEQFKVTVEDVNIAVIKGKSKKSYRKNGRSVAGKRSDVKKAYVTLKKGDSLPIFAAEEEQEKAAEKAAKKTKKEAK